MKPQPGDKMKVVANISGHLYAIGETVRITEVGVNNWYMGNRPDIMNCISIDGMPQTVNISDLKPIQK